MLPNREPSAPVATVPAMRIGLDGVPVSRDDVMAAYDEGRTIAQIAAHYGVDDETLRRYMHRAGIPIRRSESGLSSERARALAIRGARLRRGFP